jgi:hypothetical protein
MQQSRSNRVRLSTPRGPAGDAGPRPARALRWPHQSKFVVVQLGQQVAPGLRGRSMVGPFFGQLAIRTYEAKRRVEALAGSLKTPTGRSRRGCRPWMARCASMPSWSPVIPSRKSKASPSRAGKDLVGPPAEAEPCRPGRHPLAIEEETRRMTVPPVSEAMSSATSRPGRRIALVSQPRCDCPRRRRHGPRPRSAATGKST